MLDEVADAPPSRLSVPVRIGQKPKGGQAADARGRHRARGQRRRRGGAACAHLDVVGAVAWTWCRPELARPAPALDVLVVDEAGQMSLANVLACAPAARMVVLLGDPQQLDQPTQGAHPPGAERSALSHLLADPAYVHPDRPTITDAEGLFLDQTWRLHPDVCRFTSEAFYADRLRPVDGLERQRIVGGAGSGRSTTGLLSGTGLRYLPVPHAGNATDSPEEAAAIAELDRRPAVERHALGRPRTGSSTGSPCDDIVVVAPYNAHVGVIERRCAEIGLPTVFAGTVDKFQGQEAPISIYAMGTSTPEDAPRGHGVPVLAQPPERGHVAGALRRRDRRCRPRSSGSPAGRRARCSLANGLCLADRGGGAARQPGRRPPTGGARRRPVLVLFPHLDGADAMTQAEDLRARRSAARVRNALVAGVALGSTGHIAAVTVATIVAKEMLGSQALAGAPGATVVLGAAIGSIVLSRADGAHRPAAHRAVRGLRDRRAGRADRGRRGVQPGRFRCCSAARS